MEEQTKEQLLARIRELEAQVRSLNNSIIDRKDEYGLRWIDVPEAFEAESENKIPILEEVKDLAIKNDDGKPTHILIEGDNYHALQCLNYTHRGKVDVIYIDPPYNTGKEFVYKDKRVLDKFPNGQTIDGNHPLRHSAWLSFMSKRLELAKNLLSEKGVIFISIDDNEQANLKLLCDKVFGEENLITQFSWRKKTGANDAKDIAIVTEAIITYAKSKSFCIENNIWAQDADSVDLKRYKYKDKFLNERGRFYYDTLDRGGLQYSDSMNYGIEMPDGKILYPNGRDHFENDGWIWKWSKDKVEWGIKNCFLEFSKSSKNSHTHYTIKYKVYENVDNEGNIRTKKGRAFMNLITEPINQQGNTEMKELFEGNTPFSNPKPVGLIQYLINTLKRTPSTTILDFFAGSGTTLHATMKLNDEDGGNRQCILVNVNENNICRDVTYERNRRVMQGYTNAKGEQVAGLGNSLKYYKTAFVGNNAAASATDEDKVALAHKAGNLIAIAENTLEEIETSDSYQIFQNGNQYTAIYFTGNLEHFAEYVQKIEELRNNSRLVKVSAYIYCIGNVDVFESEFNKLTRINLHAIPQPIIEIYGVMDKN